MTITAVAKPKDASGAPPAFVPVTLIPAASAPRSSAPSPSTPLPPPVLRESGPPPLALTLRLPTGVETQVVGLDADTLTLVMLELVGTVAR
jgi:hypothetical protein